MTVAELIDKLKEFPQDMEVVTDGFFAIEEIKIRTWTDGNYPYTQPDKDYVYIE